MSPNHPFLIRNEPHPDYLDPVISNNKESVNDELELKEIETTPDAKSLQRIQIQESACSPSVKKDRESFDTDFSITESWNKWFFLLNISKQTQDVIIFIFAIISGLLTVTAAILSITWYIYAIHISGSGVFGFSWSNSDAHISETRGVYLAKGNKFAVASDHRTCSHIGFSILKMGGNAVDSAIATSFCIGIMNSFSSGIGGGAVLLISENESLIGNVTTSEMGYNEDGVHIHVINSREKAPSAAHKDMFKDDIGMAQVGSKAIAVPGEVLGMYTAWKKHGKISWHYLVEPSISLARIHKISKITASILVEKKDIIMNHPHLEEFRRIYAPNGKLLKEGDYVRNEKLAQTLRLIADEGAYTFYNGTVAKMIVQDIQDLGGIITEQDLADYTVKEEDPICTHFFDSRVCSSPSEISGGSCNIFALNILEQLYKRIPIFKKDKSAKSNQLLFHHYTIEAMKWIFAHRMNLGDPNFVDIESIVNDMVSKAYARKVALRIPDDRTESDFKKYAPLNNPSIFSSVPNGGTTHLSVLDSENRTVSMTSTINLYFGSMVIGKRTGILFNDEMDDFSTPGQYNAFNLPPSKANYIAPGKRPLSSMSPTIIHRNGELYMSVGASGGPKIITATLQAILNKLVFDKRLDASIASPRFHHQLLPPHLYIDKEFDQESKEYFKSLGHNLQEIDFSRNENLGVVQGIVIENGQVHAVSDWRKPVGRAFAH